MSRLKEVSSFQGCPYRGVPLYTFVHDLLLLIGFSVQHYSYIVIIFCWFVECMLVVYDICTRIIELNSKQNESTRLKNDGSGHKNGTELLDWNASHDSSQLQQ